jgi:hypothetical protein
MGISAHPANVGLQITLILFGNIFFVTFLKIFLECHNIWWQDDVRSPTNGVNACN